MTERVRAPAATLSNTKAPLSLSAPLNLQEELDVYVERLEPWDDGTDRLELLAMQCERERERRGEQPRNQADDSIAGRSAEASASPRLACAPTVQCLLTVP